MYHIARPSLIDIYNEVEFGYYCMSVAARSWCSSTPPTPIVPRVLELGMDIIAPYHCMNGLKEPPPYEDNDDESKSTNRSVLYTISPPTSLYAMFAVVTHLLEQ
jgi:hypothetical protein